jgi:peptidoglycan/xylan/chitin deacetylase (PgdA/CDA1 family)
VATTGSTGSTGSTGEGSSLVALRPPVDRAVLTYDDGPTPGVTDELLPLLADAGATATFFVLLTRVRASPALFREVLAAGHEVALHGPDHLRLTSLPPDAHAARFRDAKAELEDLAGAVVRWSRPPYGAQDIASWRAARDTGLQPVLWSVSCLDWETHPQEDYLAELRSTDPTGTVILLHDGFADDRDGVDDGPAPELDRLALTRAVLDELASYNLAVRSVGDALPGAEPVHQPWLESLGDPR